MTYKQVDLIHRQRYNKSVKPCWIADVLRKYGKIKRKAPNRIGIESTNPCPDRYFSNVEKILRELGMI